MGDYEADAQTPSGSEQPNRGPDSERLPHRVQRRRVRGWRMPENTVYVGRGTKWGNPFKVGARNPCGTITQDRRHAFMLYVGFAPINDKLVETARAELRGKNLACWCPETPGHRTCHADVLLEIANAEEPKIRALAPPDARASGASPQESKEPN